MQLINDEIIFFFVSGSSRVPLKPNDEANYIYLLASCVNHEQDLLGNRMSSDHCGHCYICCRCCFKSQTWTKTHTHRVVQGEGGVFGTPGVIFERRWIDSPRFALQSNIICFCFS